MSPYTSELFEFDKMLFIYLITSFVSFFWFLKMILNKEIILKKTFLDIPIVILILTLVVSTLFSIDIHTSLFGYYGRFNGGLFSILCYLVLFYAFVSNEIPIRGILISSLISSLLVILWGLPGKTGHDLTCLLITKKFNNLCWSRETNVFDPAQRMFSTIGQPNWLGAFLTVNFFFGLYFLVKNIKNIKYLFINFAYLIINFTGVLFSRSKSALGALAIGLVLYIVYNFFLLKKSRRLFLVLVTTIVIIPVLLFKTGITTVDKYLSISNLKSQISNFKSQISNQRQNNVKKNRAIEQPGSSPTSSDVTDSLSIRKIVWRGAYALGLRYPFFGTGPETFAYSYFFVRPQSHNLTSEWDFIYNKAHNEFLNYLATTGFIGLASYLLFIFGFQFSILKKFSIFRKKEEKEDEKDRLLAVSLLIAYITILITNFFGFSTTTANLFFYLIPAFLIVALNHQKSPPGENRGKVINTLQYISIFVMSSVMIYFLYSLTVYYLADTNYAKGVNYAKANVNDFQKAATYFEKALSLRREHVYEDRFSASLAYLASIAAYQNEKELAKNLIKASDYYNQKSLISSPKNVLYWKTRAKNEYLFYLVDQDLQKISDGITTLNKALVFAPTDPKLYYSQAVFYSILFQAEKNTVEKAGYAKKTLDYINRAIDEKNNFYDAYMLKGQFLKNLNETEEARKSFEEALKINPENEEVKKELQSF